VKNALPSGTDYEKGGGRRRTTVSRRRVHCAVPVMRRRDRKNVRKEEGVDLEKKKGGGRAAFPM